MKKILLIIIGITICLSPIFSLEIQDLKAEQDYTSGKIDLYYTVIGEELPHVQYDFELYVIINGKAIGPLQQIKQEKRALSPGNRILKWDPKGEAPIMPKEKVSFKMYLIEKKTFKTEKDTVLEFAQSTPFVIEHDGLRLVIHKVKKLNHRQVHVFLRIENPNPWDLAYNQGTSAYQLILPSRQQLDHSRITIDPKLKQQPHRFAVKANTIIEGKIIFSDSSNLLADLKPGDRVRFQGRFNQQDGAIDNIPVE